MKRQEVSPLSTEPQTPPFNHTTEVYSQFMRITESLMDKGVWSQDIYAALRPLMFNYALIELEFDMNRFWNLPTSTFVEMESLFETTFSNENLVLGQL